MLKTINGFSQTEERGKIWAARKNEIIEGQRLFPAPQPAHNVQKTPQTPSL